MPGGCHGGHEGSNNEFLIEKSNGELDGPFGKYNQYPLNKGDKVILRTATGGGFGDPHKRAKKLIEKDIKNEYITLQQAKEIYNYK